MNAINFKRQQFRREIIKKCNSCHIKEKQEFFMNRRRELMKRHIEQEDINPVLALKQRVNMKETFQYIRDKIADSDYHAKILKYVQEGLISILMNFLQEGVNIQQTLQIIYDILSKKESQLHHANTFYNYGILEYVTNYLQGTPKISSLCAFILSSLTSKSNDYCQVLLSNRKHEFLMEQFMRRVCNSRNAEEQNDSEGENFYINLLNTVESMLVIQDSTLDFAQQKLEIFRFALMLVQRRLFLKTTIGILFESVKLLQKSIVVAPALALANVILGEVKIDDNYLYNLFALIFIIVQKCNTVELNFPEFFKLGVLSKKIQRPFIRILEFYFSDSRKYLHIIPKNQEWWQKILESPQTNETHCLILRFIDKLDISNEWIWRVFAAALAQQNLQVQSQAINILNIRIRNSPYERDILILLHKHRITTLLNHLSIHGRTQTIKDSASNLDDYILGPLTDRNSEMM